MPEFLNPFVGAVPGRTLTLRELTRAVRLSLAAEEEAVHLYEAIADATDHPLAKAVLQDVANEERVHAGEFQRLLNLLLPDEAGLMAEGAAEVDEEAEEIGGAAESGEAETGGGADEGGEAPTIGNMKD
ncbi:MAG: ferritin-like domain-containing protein [Planctomycetota bacterium]